MLDALRLYRRYLAISMRAQLQYRASFVMQAIGQLLITGVEFLGIWALFARFGSLAGWTLPEVALCYGLADVTFAIADAAGRGFDLLGALVKSGDFDRILLRPRSPVLQLMGQELTVIRVGRLAQGLAVLLWASHAAGVVWSPARLLLAAGAIAGGVCLYLGITILQATSVFWTVETLELWNAFSYGGNYASQYPLPIFRRWFRRFLLVVLPLGCVNYLPVVALLGRREPLGVPPLLQWLAPLAGVVFLGVALLVWRGGVRRYTSTGS
jgi:ABC-2 type transport system permease protein